MYKANPLSSFVCVHICRCFDKVHCPTQHRSQVDCARVRVDCKILPRGSVSLKEAPGLKAAAGGDTRPKRQISNKYFDHAQALYSDHCAILLTLTL